MCCKDQPVAPGLQPGGLGGRDGRVLSMWGMAFLNPAKSKLQKQYDGIGLSVTS